MSFKWNDHGDARLLIKVDQAIGWGFHRIDGPDRADDMGKRILFWDVVAIMFSEGTHSPSPAACAARFMTALDRATDPNLPSLPGVVKDTQLMIDLRKLDDVWHAVTSEMLDSTLERVERIASDVLDLHKELDNRLLEIYTDLKDDGNHE